MKKKHQKDFKKWQVQRDEQKEAAQAKKWFGLWRKKTLEEPVKEVKHVGLWRRKTLEEPVKEAMPFDDGGVAKVRDLKMGYVEVSDSVCSVQSHLFLVRALAVCRSDKRFVV